PTYGEIGVILILPNAEVASQTFRISSILFRLTGVAEPPIPLPKEQCHNEPTPAATIGQCAGVLAVALGKGSMDFESGRSRSFSLIIGPRQLSIPRSVDFTTYSNKT